jgi:hypothetical protein
MIILAHYDGSSIKMSKFTWFLLGLLVLAGIAQIVRDVYFLLEGKKEYERRKKEEEELEK